MALFYLPEIKNKILHLSPEESRHAIKVLRLNQGDQIQLIDGEGGWYEAVIDEAHPKKCTFEIIDNRQEESKDFYIHIAIAPTKNIDRIEWFVEKSVEIGIDEISFINCNNSERKVLKNERIKKKAISAMKQSLKAKMPKINELKGFDSFLKTCQQDELFLTYVDFENPHSLQHIAPPQSDYCVLIGPEGDFTEKELANALSVGFKKVSLGSSRLRTETAGLVACHLLNVLNT